MSRHPSTPFARRRADSVAALGESGLIAALRRWLGSAGRPSPFGIGDDCALLPLRPRRAQLLTVDPVVYGLHFDASVPPEAAGAKLLKRNLSDIAAMGGRPTAAVVSLLLDPRTSRAWLERFYRGLAGAARRHRVPIVGGDVAQAEGVFAAGLTLLGEAAGARTLTRSGARTGDSIYVTGVLGGSRRSGHHHAFVPRLAEGAWLAARPAVRAMMDLSDGLAKDLAALTPAGCRPAIFAQRLPRRAGASLAAALGEGEDYELLFALARETDPKAFERAWRKAFPRTPLACIGHFAAARNALSGAIPLDRHRGFEHLAE